jgi:hypothetical protein
MAVSFKNLTLNDGTQIWLGKDTGIVESVKDWSETHISSSGGGGYVSGGSGYVPAPTVSSRSVHRQVFFLKHEDGTQGECNTNLINVSVGHKVTKVWGAKQGKDRGGNLGFYNHTTNKQAFYGLKEYDYRDFGQRRLGCLFSAVLFLSFSCLLLYGCLKSMVPSVAHQPDPLFWIWLFVSVGFAVYVYLRMRHLKRFYEDLMSQALAFMREG